MGRASSGTLSKTFRILWAQQRMRSASGQMASTALINPGAVGRHRQGYPEAPTESQERGCWQDGKELSSFWGSV